MKYNVEITIPEKPAKPPKRQAHFFVPEQIYVDFMQALKQKKVKMNPVVVDFMKNFVVETQREGQQANQPNLPFAS